MHQPRVRRSLLFVGLLAAGILAVGAIGVTPARAAAEDAPVGSGDAPLIAWDPAPVARHALGHRLLLLCQPSNAAFERELQAYLVFFFGSQQPFIVAPASLPSTLAPYVTVLVIGPPDILDAPCLAGWPGVASRLRAHFAAPLPRSTLPLTKGLCSVLGGRGYEYIAAIGPDTARCRNSAYATLLGLWGEYGETVERPYTPHLRRFLRQRFGLPDAP